MNTYIAQHAPADFEPDMCVTCLTQWPCSTFGALASGDEVQPDYCQHRGPCQMRYSEIGETCVAGDVVQPDEDQRREDYAARVSAEVGEPVEVVDLVAALRASVEAAKQRRERIARGEQP